jgi:hypothetical protein
MVKDAQFNDDAFANLEALKKAAEEAAQKYEDGKKKQAEVISNKINTLVTTAQFSADQFYESCFSSLVTDSEQAIPIAIKMLKETQAGDDKIHKAFRDAGLLVTLGQSIGPRAGGTADSATTGKKTRTKSFMYKLEPGEREKLDSGDITEGVHRHDPAFWCPTMGKSETKPDWFFSKDKSTSARFVRSEEEDKLYKEHAKSRSK